MGNVAAGAVGGTEMSVMKSAHGHLSGIVSCRVLLGESDYLTDSVTFLLPSPGNVIQVTENIIKDKFIDQIY